MFDIPIVALIQLKSYSHHAIPHIVRTILIERLYGAGVMETLDKQRRPSWWTHRELATNARGVQAGVCMAWLKSFTHHCCPQPTPLVEGAQVRIVALSKHSDVIVFVNKPPRLAICEFLKFLKMFENLF